MIRSLMRASALLMLCLLTLPAAAGSTKPATAPTSVAAAPVILIVGDSLSAAFGISQHQGWAALLQERLRDKGYPHRVVNSSISGETTAAGLARLSPLLNYLHPQWVLIELGGNDGLRGLPLERMRGNLTQMVKQSQAAGAKALLFEMVIPANYGQDYGKGFTQSFADVAHDTGATLVPFFLQAFATEPEAFQNDGLHPNVSAQPMMLDAVWPTLEKALGAAR